MRPAYLELHQTSADTFDVVWKVPAAGRDRRLALYVRFPAQSINLTEPRGTFSGGAHLERWRVKAPNGLSGERLTIDGLSATMTDVLVRIERLDGTAQVARVTPANPSFTVEASPDIWEVVRTYATLGVEHILTGVDHLLFVLALILITMRGAGYGSRDTRSNAWIPDLASRISNLIPLIKTITAFTVAHSITLTAATLGFVHVPQRPVEAVIALSIVFVAVEIVRNQMATGIRDAGYAMSEADIASRIPYPASRIPSLTTRAPWMVAFTFGLLHGLGFAGALSEVGLPQAHIPLALLFFNVGVEIGQLLFIAAVLSLLWAVRETLEKMQDTRCGFRDPGYAFDPAHRASRISDLASRITLVPAYAIGAVAMFWVIQRLAVF